MLFINITYSLICKYQPLPESLLLEGLKKEKKKNKWKGWESSVLLKKVKEGDLAQESQPPFFFFK